MKQFKSIFNNHQFQKLFLANVTSKMGSVIGLTAFMYYVLDRFSSQPSYAAITELMYSLPTLAVFFLVGVIADRLDRQKIAYYCDWISACLSVGLLGAIYLGWMPLIFFVLFFRSAVQKFFFPAEQGLLQGILKKDEFTAAAGINQLVESIFMLFGNALGIFIYWSMGIYGAVIIDIITFIISGLCIKTMKMERSIRNPNGSHTIKDLNLPIVWRDFKLGYTYIYKNKLLFSLIIGFIVFGVVNGGFSVMQVFILKYKLAPDDYEQVSIYLGVVFGAGVLIGSFISSFFTQKMKLYQLIIGSIFLIALFTIMASFATSLFWFMCINFIIAFFLPLLNIAIGGWMPAIIEPKMMGRVQGWVSPLMMLSQSITLGVITVGFPAYFSVEAIFCLVGGCFVIVGIYYSFVLPGLAKNAEEEEIQKRSSKKERNIRLNY
ncbi:MFS transporter [Niallia sp. 03133]|uniref:MFS transporter n=1 Tax=Niallia sp. 03133 TaxID=3458060 RepID=UPI0040442D0A